MVTRLLNRPGLRWALRIYVRLEARRRHGLRVRAEHRDGFWIVHWPGMLVPGPEPLHSPPPAEQEALAAEVFLQEYRPREGDAIVEIGAGVGWEIGLWSRLVGPSGTVVAVEADPDTFEWLERRCQLNGLDNVVRLQVAIADRPGVVQMEGDGPWEGRRIAAADTGTRVEAITFGELLARTGLDHVDLVKMNIEGAESLVLRGMGDAFARVGHFVVSCHDYMLGRGETDPGLRTKDEVVAMLTAAGFTVVRRDPADQRDWAGDYVYASAP
jgi:FkbM family methyltransferase